jgi:hypothetical protein
MCCGFYFFLIYCNVCFDQIFVQDNQGGAETTVIQHLQFIGESRQVADMSQFAKDKDAKE